ncbi:CaiB/BaiF CoA transferase family protein [Azospirillum doebereinerae]|uniref:CaiB/BaiF CoA transferase family protein n=1 Tax=Azospirillum doebereinerae TaxID=92933 RepID=UPI001EE53C3E|nr:CaiB/BaiF CoA-transferase family protein [Azospirillum doebereinerae]MCG5242205.1 CoA transferase [Azospirillum doebereinerae]
MTASATRGGPLAGVRVVEFAGLGPVPFAGMLLSDMGADVVRIERGGVERLDAQDITARGRRFVALDLKNPAQAETARRLADGADILLEGFRPGVMERLGLGPEPLLARNPRLVYGRMTGWGQDGPLANAVGHDITYIAITGALAAIGPGDGKPVPPLNLVGDYGGGALYLAMGVLAALNEAGRSGRGQVVDAAMCDGVFSLLSMFQSWLNTGQWAERREANMLDGGAPYYTTYACRDGKHIAVGAIEPQFYATLLRLTGLAEDPAFAAQHDSAQWPALREKMQALFLTRDRDDWAALLEGTDACVAPVLTMGEARHHPHVAARQSLVEHGGVVQTAPAPRFSRTPSAIRNAPPQEPDDPDAILADWARRP